MFCSLILRVFQQKVYTKFSKSGWRKQKYLFFYNNCHHRSSHDNTTKSSERSTIFALSTSSGMSAIAIIRVSGPNTSTLFRKVAKLKKFPSARTASLCRITDPDTDELLDKALVFWFPSPNSFTGEDLCELHIHGGVAVIKSILRVLQKLPHFRFAEPGEFTKRAFMAGKLDLTEVEGLADLLHAETEAQQRQALRQMDGALTSLYADWSERVKKCLARIEAYIDFSEDQHLDETIFDSVKTDLDVLKSEISAHLQDGRKGEKLRSGVFAVIAGRPNVGKSSLLNSLCRRDVAIVSPVAGTTRDVLETSLNLGGYLVHICDTAGIRDSPDSVEREGVRRARDRSSKADLLIFILEARTVLDLLSSHSVPKQDLQDFLLSRELGEDFRSAGPSSVLVLLNKMDLLDEMELRKVRELRECNPCLCAVSCAEGTGMTDFVNAFSEEVKNICCSHSGEQPAITQERHRLCLQSCLQRLEEFEPSSRLDAAIAAEDLRAAMASLGRITGRVRAEEVLDVIFRDFCIGK